MVTYECVLSKLYGEDVGGTNRYGGDKATESHKEE